MTREILVRLIYTSKLDGAILEEESSMICAAKKYNTENHISGILLCGHDFVFQMLEGSRDSINELYSKISRDQRHKDLVLLRYHEIKNREFADWDFAFITSKDLEQNNLLLATNPSQFTSAQSLATIRRISILLQAEQLMKNNPLVQKCEHLESQIQRLKSKSRVS